MNLETLGVWVLALGGIATALVAIFVLIKRLWVIFGWKGSFWAWAKKFVDTVDVISTLPATLDGIDTKLSATDAKLETHLVDAKIKTDLLLLVDARTKALVDIAEDVRYEVKNNGGGSTKDAIDRIENGVAGLYATKGETGTPGREDHR